MQYRLQGKRALVCGGSQGIGRACAVELAGLGAEVTVLARNEDALQRLVDELDTKAAQKHSYVCADSGDPAALQARVAAHIEATGAIQILVNNTGGPPAGPLLDAGPEQLTAAFSNHVLCNQLLVQTLLPGMKGSGYGRIVNIISTSVIAPIKGLGVSNTIRGAAANWARTMAGELAPFGITVNNILPGYVATARLESLFQHKAEKTGISAKEIERQVVEAIPMRRLGAPAELGAVVAFLASPAASYVSGVNLPVDGGRTAVQ